jgi:hypothetical protein
MSRKSWNSSTIVDNNPVLSYLYGTLGNDRLIGQGGDEFIFGDADYMIFADGTTVILGDDRIVAGPGHDSIFPSWEEEWWREMK